MDSAEILYNEIADKIEGSVKSQMFGKPCLKINGKAFVCFYQNEMVFKLSGIELSNAIQLEGAQLFDPSGKNRPMKEWVQIPFIYSEKWLDFAFYSKHYVENSFSKT